MYMRGKVGNVKTLDTCIKDYVKIKITVIQGKY